MTTATETSDLQRRLDELFLDEFLPEVPEWERAGRVPRSAFRRLGDIGAFEARWPQGAGRFGDVDVHVALAEACARTSFGAGLCFGIHVDAFLSLLRQAPVGRELYPLALAGEVVGALAVTERSSGSEATGCRTSAERRGEGWVLRGHKHYVTNAPTATHVIVLAKTGPSEGLRDYTFFVVPTDAPGVSVTEHDLLGAHASGTAMVDLADVELEDEQVAGQPGSGLTLLLRALCLERFWAAAGVVVVAELFAEAALAFAQERRVSGRALREHQLTTHRLAEMHNQITLARALVDGLVASARDERMTLVTASQAKLLTTRMAWRVADDAMQILGGTGYTDATPLGRLWVDLRVARIAGGSDEVLQEMVGRKVAAGRLSDHPTVRAAAAAASADQNNDRRGEAWP